MSQEDKTQFIFQTFINSFYYLYDDAYKLHEMSKTWKAEPMFLRTQLFRTALLLYILSLEGLINRAMDHFLTGSVRDFFLDREEKFSLEDKWLLLPLFVPNSQGRTFDKGGYPWNHFAELVKLRNDYVHPKHDRFAFYRVFANKTLNYLQWNQLPQDLPHPTRNRKLKEGDVVYPLTKIPKDPYTILPEHLDTARKVVDDMVNELDKLLNGKITENNWHITDQMKLVYPPGAKLSDIPSNP